MLGDRLAGGARSPADSCSKIFGRAASRPELTSSGELKRFSQNMSQAETWPLRSEVLLPLAEAVRLQLGLRYRLHFASSDDDTAGERRCLFTILHDS